MKYIIIDDATNEIISIDDSFKQLQTGVRITHQEITKTENKIWIKP